MEKDVTFIVFNCGRSERIGIRHRETQTLYLSDLIDPTCMKGYGQIHLGLLIAALKDRLDKLNLVEEPKAPVRKRPRESIRSLRDNGMKDKATRRKRRKLSPDPELTSPTSVELDRKVCHVYTSFCFAPLEPLMLDLWRRISKSRPHSPVSQFRNPPVSCTVFIPTDRAFMRHKTVQQPFRLPFQTQASVPS